jgi:hypothetical protein
MVGEHICNVRGGPKAREGGIAALPYLMRTIPDRMILGGDFICVLAQADCTRKVNFSRALQELARIYELVDVRAAKPTRAVYTHYTRQRAMRIDRLYVSRNISESKRSVETVPTDMTDHLAVVVRMVCEGPVISRGRDYWKMNVTLFKEQSVREEMRENWGRSRKNKKYYSNRVKWWVKAVKQRIRKLYTRVGSERRQKDRGMESFYYQCIYDLLQNHEKRLGRVADVNMLKAKIVKLHSMRMEGVKFEAHDSATFNDERSSTYHIIKQKKRREQRTITRILDQEGRTQTTNRGIVGVFHEFLRSKFEPINVDAECVRRMVEAVHGRVNEVGRDVLNRSLDLEELRGVLQKGGGNKAPWRDGICRSFFTETWDELKEGWLKLFSEMFER